MPSPSRDGANSRIAYTRWEPLGTQDEDADQQQSSSNNNVEFHYFEEESQPKFNGSLR